MQRNTNRQIKMELYLFRALIKKGDNIIVEIDADKLPVVIGEEGNCS